MDGYYTPIKDRPREERRAVVLTDDEVIDLVNLKLVSEAYGYDPDEVLRLRSKGKNFVVPACFCKGGLEISNGSLQGKNDSDTVPSKGVALSYTNWLLQSGTHSEPPFDP